MDIDSVLNDSQDETSSCHSNSFTRTGGIEQKLILASKVEVNPGNNHTPQIHRVTHAQEHEQELKATIGAKPE